MEIAILAVLIITVVAQGVSANARQIREWMDRRIS